MKTLLSLCIITIALIIEFVYFYKLGYHTGRIDELKESIETLEEIEKMVKGIEIDEIYRD